MESPVGRLKDSSVVVVTLDSSEVYIIVSLAVRSDTQVIYIDPTTGETLNFITNGSKWLCKSVTYAKIATKLTASIPNLPGGGCVYTLLNPQPQGKGELKNVQELTDLDIDGKHYFCDTKDITRPFQSYGFAECRIFGSSGQQEGVVALTARRSRLHPGTRYLARGLNGCFSTDDYAEAEIYISARDPYKGSSQYYQRLSTRYGTCNIGGNAGSSQNKIYAGKSECILVQHFEESINYIRSTGKLPNTRIHLVHYDWHASTKLKGEKQTIEGLWIHLKAPTIKIICTKDLEGAFCLRSHQNGVIRFNCADSLDRTNAASYFGGFSLDSDMALGYPSVNNYGGYVAPLPPGWENVPMQTTTWVHPCPDKPWKRFDMTFEEFKRSTILSPVSQLADLFLLAGDIHATLYTGSRAMHSEILSIFNEETGGKFKQFSVAQNVKISLQRRYKNTIVDSSRQKQLEMFLGMRLFKHLPSLAIHPLKVLSRPSACFLKPVTSVFPSSTNEANLLSFKKKDLIWPCHVCQLLLTISHGADDSTFPATVDVRTGRDLDGLKLVLEGGSIPQCVTGTNLLIPLAGPVSPEDMAVTGAGARRHQETRSLSLLYDFEELEGELDFLTRVVALTFYPAVRGKTPLTIGEIEILGMSLPWKGIFTKEGPGEKFWELLNKHQGQEEENPFLSSSETNPFVGSSVSSENDLPSAQLTSPASLTFDFLTGDIGVSDTISQQQMPDLLDFLDNPIVEFNDLEDSKFSSLPQDGRPEDNTGIQHYTDCFKALIGPHMARKIDFEEAMRLEIERLRVNLSAAERDRTLLSIGTDPATVDPNGLLDESYMGRLCKIANSLALLGQAALEDKVTAAIGLDTSDDDIIDFWNICGIGETCSGGLCAVRAVTQPCVQVPSLISSGGNSPPILTCSRCKRKACKVCCAGKGALLLSSPNSKEVGGYNGSLSGQSDGGRNRTARPDGIICKSCCNEVILDALILDYVRALISLRRSTRADSAARKALYQVMGLPSKEYHLERNRASDNVLVPKNLRKLLNGEESLAEFPTASLLHTVQIWASNKMNKEERSCMGKWEVQSLIQSSSEYYGLEQSDTQNVIPRHIRFTFRIQFEILIFFSLDENPFEHHRRNSFGGTVQSDPCLHARRLLVVGSSVPVEAERLSDNDCVMEQYLSLGSPELAGFRIDAFSAIQPRITHSPSSDANIWDNSLTWLEDRHIFPAILFIQVCAYQESNNMVTVGEYRLPMARAGHQCTSIFQELFKPDGSPSNFLVMLLPLQMTLQNKLTLILGFHHWQQGYLCQIESSCIIMLIHTTSENGQVFLQFKCYT
ncbi:hypothetical protein MKW92_000098 [Papaver armeniacum]|nr:hypothetical protein MKW92_000098 [Papaver armeniacum]